MKRLGTLIVLVATPAVLAACAHNTTPTAATPGQADQQRIKVAAVLKRAADESADNRVATDTGVIFSRTFDGQRFSSIIKAKGEAGSMPDGAKQVLGERIAELVCNDELSLEAMQAGYSAGVDLMAENDQVLLSVTLNQGDCD